MLPAPARSPLGLATLRAPRLRGRCIVATGPDHVVLCDHAVRGSDRLSSVLVLELDGCGRAWWGNPDTGPDALPRLEASRDLAEGAQRFVVEALCDRAAQGDPLGSLEVRRAGRGSLSWTTGRLGPRPALRGAISDARTERAGPARAWVHDGVHRHLPASPAMTWTVDGRCVSLWLELDGHVVTIQIESGAAVGTVDGELTAFVAELGAPRIDPGSLLATPGGGRIRGPGIDLEFAAVGPVGEGGPLSAIVGCVSLEVQGRLADRVLMGRGVLVDRAVVTEPLEARFERAGAMVAASVACLVPPREPATQAQAVSGLAHEKDEARALHRLGPVIGRPAGGPFMVGLDGDALDRALLAPIRLITDRGGKAWRSYLMHLCGRACGGSMAPYTELMAVPELVHVGSLIVDDVQDASEVRRGGPSCHAVHGTPLAINAGNAAYFLSELAIRRTPLEPQVRQRVLDLLFDGFRAGHAGQALDIAGLESAVDPAIESGSFEALEQRVLTIQWLKSGVPAGAFARMGAVVGTGPGGDGALVEVLGEYFERVGTAFQIVDDVLNLRGFEGDLKQRGEDLSTAKVTLPLLACLARLDRATARSLWHAIRARPTAPARLESLCRQLEATGGIQAAHRRAMEMVDEAWEAVDRLVEDGQAKIELRALGRFLLLRFY